MISSLDESLHTFLYSQLVLQNAEILDVMHSVTYNNLILEVSDKQFTLEKHNVVNAQSLGQATLFIQSPDLINKNRNIPGFNVADLKTDCRLLVLPPYVQR